MGKFLRGVGALLVGFCSRKRHQSSCLSGRGLQFGSEEGGRLRLERSRRGGGQRRWEKWQDRLLGESMADDVPLGIIRVHSPREACHSGGKCHSSVVACLLPAPNEHVTTFEWRATKRLWWRARCQTIWSSCCSCPNDEGCLSSVGAPCGFAACFPLAHGRNEEDPIGGHNFVPHSHALRLHAVLWHNLDRIRCTGK